MRMRESALLVNCYSKWREFFSSRPSGADINSTPVRPIDVVFVNNSCEWMGATRGPCVAPNDASFEPRGVCA